MPVKDWVETPEVALHLTCYIETSLSERGVIASSHPSALLSCALNRIHHKRVVKEGPWESFRYACYLSKYLSYDV